MNWLIRLGQWLEKRKVARQSEVIVELDALKIDYQQRLIKVWEAIDVLQLQAKVPPQIVRDMAILKQQMDRMELYVGLKREPQAMHVAGTPKIS